MRRCFLIIDDWVVCVDVGTHSASQDDGRLGKEVDFIIESIRRANNKRLLRNQMQTTTWKTGVLDTTDDNAVIGKGKTG